MALDDGQGQSLSEIMTPILGAFKRYWKISLAPAVALALVVGAVSYRLPGYYKADAIIYSQPQRLATKFIENPDKDELSERLEAVVQEVLSRPRLRSIVDKFKLYPEFKGVSAVESAIRELRSNIAITPAKSQTGTKLSQTFQLTFSHSEPRMAYEVTKAVSNLFIEESILNQRTEVQGTEEFLDSQLATARKRLEETENQVQEFVRQNFGKLPDHLDQAIARLNNTQQQVDNNTQLITANLQRKANLEAELAEVKRLASYSADPKAGGAEAYDPQESLVQLQQALVVLSSRYSEQHPDVVNTKKRIELLKEEIAKGGGTRKGPMSLPRGGGFTAASVMEVRRQLNEIDLQISTLKAENVRLNASIEALRNDIEQMPIKEQELVKIKRDYNNVQDSYNKLLAARQEAGIQSSLMRSQKGTQFSLLEPPEMPIAPAGPPRLLIALGGLVVGLVLFFGVPIAVYFLNSGFRSKDELQQNLGVTVLGVIPPMITPEALATKKRLFLYSVAGSFAFALVGTTAVFVFVR